MALESDGVDAPRPTASQCAKERGTLAQYVGRLHRLHPAKREVLVYDYVDEAVPVLRRMTQKRIRGYRNLGYSVEQPGGEKAM